MTTSYQSFNRGGQFQRSQVDLGSQQQERVNAQNVADLERNSQALFERDLQASRDTQRAADGLAQFSTSLSEILINRQKKENEKQMLEGMREYWFNGATEEETAAFRADEAALGEARAASDKAAGDYEKQGGDVFVAEGIRNLSGWKAYGFAKAMLTQAGANYGTFYTQKGQELGLNEISDPRKRAAIEQQIREEYMMQFAEMNPLLLHEHLFPSMRRFEQAEQLAYANRQAKVFQKNRELSRKQDLYGTFISSDPEQTANNILAWVDSHKGQFGGDSKVTFAAATEMIREGLGNGSIDPQAFLNALDAVVTPRDGNSRTLKEFRSNDLALLEETARSALSAKLKRDIDFFDNEDRAKILEAQKEYREAKVRDDDFIRYLKTKYRFNDPRYANQLNWLTDQGFDDQLITDDIDDRLNRGLVVSVDEVYRINDYETRTEYLKKVTNNDRVMPPEAILERHQKLIEAQVKDITQVFEFDSKENLIGTENAMALYKVEYQVAMSKVNDPQAASEIAYQKVTERLKDSPTTDAAIFRYTKTEVSTDNANTLVALSQRAQNGTLDFDSKIEGLDSQVNQLNESLNAKKGIPFFWQTLANKHGVNVYELIDTQLRAYGYKGFPIPKAYSDIEQYPRQTRRLIQFHKTGSREVRAAVSVEDARWFLDSIASVESRGYGEYDAFNRGGSNNGYTPHGSGNSTVDLDIPITSMTLGEIKRRQALPYGDSQGLHAVGRYQFIGPTFAEVQRLTGLPDDAVFDERTQDIFALTRAVQRVTEMNGGNRIGLINEWRALRFLSDEELVRMVQIAKGLGPYRQVHMLLPGVAKATLKPN